MNDTPRLSAERVGPFRADMAQRRPNREGQVQVNLHASTVAQLTQIQTWIGGWPALAQKLAPLMPVPATTGHSATQDGHWIARTGPEELWCVSNAHAPWVSAVRAAITPDIGHTLDLSHARCVLAVQGPCAVPTLQKLFALDFRESAFAVGQLRLSGAHHLPALIHRKAINAFDLYLHTTYAHDQVESVWDAALEWGAQLSIERT